MNIRRVFAVLLLVIFSFVVGGLLIVGARKARDAADRIQCSNNLKQIGLAIHNYHDTYNRFPPAAKPSPNLSPQDRLSWMYGILPFLESNPLYSRYDGTKSWDADENRFGALTVYHLYQCPGYPDRPAVSKFVPTPYLGIAGVGKDAVELPLEDPKAGFFGYERKISFKDIKDDRATTLMVVETAWASGAWTAGGPATVRGFDPEGSPYLGVPGQFGGNHPGGANALFADASVRFLNSSLDPQVVEAMATIAGGEEIILPVWDK
jgi:prepilin-type processing-associated H-X9-DG protein